MHHSEHGIHNSEAFASNAHQYGWRLISQSGYPSHHNNAPTLDDQDTQRFPPIMVQHYTPYPSHLTIVSNPPRSSPPNATIHPNNPRRFLPSFPPSSEFPKSFNFDVQTPPCNIHSHMTVMSPQSTSVPNGAHSESSIQYTSCYYWGRDDCYKVPETVRKYDLQDEAAANRSRRERLRHTHLPSGRPDTFRYPRNDENSAVGLLVQDLSVKDRFPGTPFPSSPDENSHYDESTHDEDIYGSRPLSSTITVPFTSPRTPAVHSHEEALQELRQIVDIGPNDELSLNALPDLPSGIRPHYPLPLLIQLAILGSEKQRLTLQDIIAALKERFKWYGKNAHLKSWQNSIRHQLSFNKVFWPVKKPVTEPGKGRFWIVDYSQGKGTKRPRKRKRSSAGSKLVKGSHKEELNFPQEDNFSRDEGPPRRSFVDPSTSQAGRSSTAASSVPELGVGSRLMGHE